MSTFKPTVPTVAELKRMRPIEGSRRIIQAYEEARAELRRQGSRGTLVEIEEFLEKKLSASTYQGAVSHVRAVDIYGISGDLAKMEAIRRMRLMEPLPRTLSAAMDEAQEWRSDPEILADAISNLVIRAGRELPEFDYKVIAGYLTRDPQKRGRTKSALTDLVKWLNTLEKAL